MKKIIIIIIACSISLISLGQQSINFFKGSFEEAMKEAAKQNKLLFVDAYADWCGPCKLLSERIFPLPEVREYFNEKFISYQLDTDAPANKDIVTKLKIEQLPTLLFINTKGEVISSNVGVIEPYGLIRMGKVALGEQKNGDELYKIYRKDKRNTDKQRDLLLDAPYFIRDIKTPSQQKKWGLRINKVFEKYVKQKGIENMANPTDFGIINRFHPVMTDKDNIINAIIKHYDIYSKAMNPEGIAQYLTGLHLNYIVELAKDGDKEYIEEYNRINGDMKNIYSKIYPDLGKFYEAYTEFSDATYFIFAEKDSQKYINSMERYFKLIPAPQYNDYALALENMINGLNENLDKNAAKKGIEWIDIALSKDHNTESKISMNMVKGDCFKALGDNAKATKLYEDTYRMLFTSKNQNFINNMQQILKQRLSSVKNQ